MQKIKEMIEIERETVKIIESLSRCTGRVFSKEEKSNMCDDIKKLIFENSELKNKMLEIFMESGECADDGNNVGYCSNTDSSLEFPCKWCAGLEKIEKLLSGSEA